MKTNRFFNVCLTLVLLISVILIVHIIVDGALLDLSLADPLYGYSFLLGGVCLLLFLAIVRKSGTFPPSAILFASFAAVPFIGPIGYNVFIKIHGSFHETQLDFAFPIFVWMVGTTALMVGILAAYFLFSGEPTRFIYRWNLRRASILLWGSVGLASLFTAYALAKIGYLPLLQSSLDEVRKGYQNVVGDYPMKFSRLWLVAASMATMLAFLKSRKRVYFTILAVSILGLLVYGQRTYAFLALTSFVLLYFKFRRPRLVYLTSLIAGAIIAFILYADYRAGRDFEELGLGERVVLNLFGEWREYSFVVDELNRTGDFYEETLFIGALAPVLPKQVWAVFGVDKDELINENSAVYVFGARFENELGIRIGTIGEAYAGYGLVTGVCLQLLLFGIIFGFLERRYLSLEASDSRLMLVCFLLSLLMYLTITTLFMTVALGVFFGFFFVLFIWAGSVRIYRPEYERIRGLAERLEQPAQAAS